jgi:histidine triad (HIT) family protein
MAYDPNNIFAKILRGEIPSHKLYEDEDTLVFLDIMPRTEGHALVITKEKAWYRTSHPRSKKPSVPTAF